MSGLPEAVSVHKARLVALAAVADNFSNLAPVRYHWIETDHGI